MDHAELIKAFGAFFAIMNPFVNLPIFLSLTEGYSVQEQRGLALRIVIYSAIMCGVIMVAGSQIIGFFGITTDVFRIAGGGVLAHIAWNMLNGSESASHHGSKTEQSQMHDVSGLAFYPITFPMVVGPGTIATLIIYAGHAKDISNLMLLGGLVGAILALLFVVLFFASNIGTHMSQTLRTILTRLMGMILLAIAVEMVVAGASAVFPALSQT